jgi:hypothetical protein
VAVPEMTENFKSQSKTLTPIYMKTRIILLLAISAIITLSFTVVSVSENNQSKAETSVQDTSGEPVGGFLAEDKL